jgi:oligopeptidase A
VSGGPSGGAGFREYNAPLDTLTERLDRAMAVVKHRESVGSTPELRAAINEVEPGVSDFRAELYSNQDLWKRVEHLAASDEARLLNEAERRFLARWQGALEDAAPGWTRPARNDWPRLNAN